MTQPDTKSWRSCQDSEPRKKPIQSSDTGQASAVPDTPARPRRLGTHTLVLRLHLAAWVQTPRANMAKTTHTDKITKTFLHWPGHQRVLMHIRQIYENGRGYDLYHVFLCNTNLFCTPSNVPKSEITVQKQGKKSECLTLDMWMCCHTTAALSPEPSSMWRFHLSETNRRAESIACSRTDCNNNRSLWVGIISEKATSFCFT